MDKVLILGISGFTGKAFLRYIREGRLYEKYYFVGVDIRESVTGEASYIHADLAQKGAVEEIISREQPAYIVNLAGTFASDDYDNMLAVNAGITRRACDCIVKKDLSLKKFLVVGSAAEYGRARKLPVKEDEPARPVNDYGLTKLIQTHYAMYFHLNDNLDINIARTFNVLGRDMPETLSVGSFVKQIRNAGETGTVFTGNLQTKRDFLDIDDVVDAYWKILISGKSGRIYNVCRGSSHPVAGALDYLIKRSGKKLAISVKDERMRIIDIPDSYGDNSLLKADTGWDWRIDLFDSLSRMINGD